MIFLFLVTHKCTDRSDREEREREREAGQRAIQREGHMGRDTEGGGKREEEGPKVPDTKKTGETREKARQRSC